MLTRRESVLGGLLTFITGAACCACGAHADHGGAAGCMLEEDEALVVFARATQAVTKDNQKVLKSCGDTELDYAIGRTLTRLSDTFGVKAGFAYIEGDQDNNAYATTRKMVAGSDGTVLFGMPYLKSKMRAKEAPDAWVAATLAHEFGHITQYKHRIPERVLPRTPTTKRLELHADFLSGYYAGTMKRRDPAYPAAIFAVSRYASGDFKTEAKGHHGTPQERAGAVVRGFETAYRENRPFAEAIQIGIRYVKTL